MVKGPPKVVEYICLLCGAQGSLQIEPDANKSDEKASGVSVRCPKCGGYALHLERETAQTSLAAALTR